MRLHSGHSHQDHIHSTRDQRPESRDHHTPRTRDQIQDYARLNQRTESKLDPHQEPDQTMHCGYVFFLFLALWAEPGAGRGVPMRKSLEGSDPDMQSTIHSLEEALKLYDSDLKQKSILTNLPNLPCTETAAQLEQSSTVAYRLSRYRVCAEQLRSLSADNKDLCNVVRLNNDLLQHLDGPYQEPADCPSPSAPSSAPLMDFNTLRQSIQCVHCWILQVEALKR